VTDQAGNVLGLESIFDGYQLLIKLGPADYIPPVISITSAAELLSPNVGNQSWSNGPLLFSANVISNSNENLNVSCDGTIPNYDTVASAIAQVLKELGGTLPVNDLPQDFLSYSIANQTTKTPDGSILTTVFAKPIELYNSAGKVLAQAKWVGIQWDRNSGDPSRVVYGSVAYLVEGSFEIVGDTSGIGNAVQAIIDAQ
jgi:hypothetical protein